MIDRIAVSLWIGLVSVSLPSSGFGQPTKNPPTSSERDASVQQQIDELKASQQQLLKELAEIKALLQERAQRADYPTKPIPPENISLGVRGEVFRGESQARVAIMEYSDFDCSFCAKYATAIYPRIETDYIKTGKIKYFFRDLPSPEHTNSLFKARVARCAGDQSHFWEMHDWLFAHPGPLAEADLADQVKALELDAPAFNECLTTGRFAENILRSATGARRIGLQGTPAFLIGTMSEDGETIRVQKMMVGGENYDAFRAILDPLLSAPAKK